MNQNFDLIHTNPSRCKQTHQSIHDTSSPVNEKGEGKRCRRICPARAFKSKESNKVGYLANTSACSWLANKIYCIKIEIVKSVTILSK